CRGQARFTGPHRLQVGNEDIESERIFINTGSRPAVPLLDGLDAVDYLTNASIMELSELPEHLLVLGGGYVGLEFGQMFRRFGSRVTIVHKADRILPREDADITLELRKALEKEGIRFLLRATAARVDKHKGEIVLVVKTGDRSETVRGSHLLVATGRRPNTDDLELDAAGVRLSKEGFI